MTEDEKHLYDMALIMIKTGDMSLADIIEEMLSIREDEGLKNVVDEDWLIGTIEDEHKKHLTASESWETPTHPDLLWEVFDELCQKNILALHNAGYTSSEAIYDVEEIWAALVEEDVKPIGYCYYHGQDLERVITTEKLIIGFYGDEENNGKKAIAIGNIIADAFRKKGFKIDWDGTASGRIIVLDFHWNNLFVSDDDSEEKWAYDRAVDIMLKN